MVLSCILYLVYCIPSPVPSCLVSFGMFYSLDFCMFLLWVLLLLSLLVHSVYLLACFFAVFSLCLCLGSRVLLSVLGAVHTAFFSAQKECALGIWSKRSPNRTKSALLFPIGL